MGVVVHLYVFMNVVRPVQRQQRLLGDGQPQTGVKQGKETLCATALVTMRNIPLKT